MYKNRSKKLKTEENSWHWDEPNDAFWFSHWVSFGKLWLFFEDLKKIPIRKIVPPLIIPHLIVNFKHYKCEPLRGEAFESYLSYYNDQSKKAKSLKLLTNMIDEFCTRYCVLVMPKFMFSRLQTYIVQLFSD